MVPGIEHTHFDQTVDPLFAKQVFKVRLAQTRAHARHDFVVQAVLQTRHRRRKHARFSAPFVADDFSSFDADQRRDVSTLAQSFGNLIGNEVPVGEDLKIDIGMGFEDLEKLFVL